MSGSVVVDSLWIITPIVGFCNCSMFVLRYFMSSLALHSSRLGRESWLLCFVCLTGVEIAVLLFLMMPRICLRFVIVVLSDHTHFLSFFINKPTKLSSYVASMHINNISISSSKFCS